LIPTLSKYNEIELLHPSLDTVVKNCLKELGFDIGHPIEYIPSKHRDMKGHIAVGFRAVGEISTDREFLNSPLATMVDRVAASARYDLSLTKELCSLMGRSLDITEDATEEDEEYPDEMMEDDYQLISNEIESLERIRDVIRGENV
jgi:hypothetical protein